QMTRRMSTVANRVIAFLSCFRLMFASHLRRNKYEPEASATGKRLPASLPGSDVSSYADRGSPATQRAPSPPAPPAPHPRGERGAGSLARRRRERLLPQASIPTPQAFCEWLVH